MIDLHSHILPGLDDGPATLEGSLELARAAVDAGTRTILATPHINDDARIDAARVAAGLEVLRPALAEAEIPLEVLPGGEIAIWRLTDLDDDALRSLALGGGHGLAASLAALRRLTPDVTAVVTVADDGGSSGRLRRELGLLPPGDLRKALTALAGSDDENALWNMVFQHRFGGTGALAGHAVGNLVLAGLLEVLADPGLALEQAARLLGVRGRVLPMSTEPLDIEADVVGLDEDATTRAMMEAI